MNFQLFIIIFSVLLEANGRLLMSGTQRWCIIEEPVEKTRTVWKQKQRLETRRNWYGGYHSYSIPYVAPEEETYWETEEKHVCCNGYTNEDDDCKPICTNPCSANSYCESPNKCACSRGYEEDPSDSAICKPICLAGCPENSACSEPEKCTCHEGFSWTDNTCQPICVNGCPDNGYCSAPQVCSCRHAYELIFNGVEEFCKPICEATCGANSYCHSPDQCACLSGYEPAVEFSDPRFCQPTCSSACPAHSACVRPEECACEEGYEMNVERTECEPVCSEECPEHSICSGPDQCLCEAGYRPLRHDDGLLHCEPHCSQDCGPYGKCVAPEQCECQSGYELRGAKAQCEPICRDGCPHGHCFAPELCVCDPGYLMGPNSTCEAVCSLGCENGACVEPEICSCFEGYRLHENSVHLCQPICEPLCTNGDCVAPDVCLCRRGYEPLQIDGSEQFDGTLHQCVPICERCRHGDCTSKTECKCWPGYEHRPDSGRDELCWKISDSLSTLSSSTELSSEPLPFDSEATSRTYSAFDSTPAILFSESTPTISADICGEQCKCWHETVHEDLVSVASTSCEHLCLDDYDMPCLSLASCRCDLDSLQLACNASDDSGEARIAHYTCRLRLTVAQTTAVSFAQGNQYSEKESAIPWALIATSIALALLLLSVSSAWIYKRRTDNVSGDLVVDYLG